MIKGKHRSWLFLPAHKHKFWKKITDLSPDVLVIDLEDSVFWNKKDSARLIFETQVKEYIPQKSIAVRINPLDSKWGPLDLSTSLNLGIVDIVLPKVKGAGDILRVHEFAKREGFDPQILNIIPIIETTQAFERFDEIATVEGVRAAIFGSEDLFAEFGLSSNRDSPLFKQIQVTLSLKAQKQKLMLIDCANPVYGPQYCAEFRKECVYSSEIAFKGKLAIHPNQIEVINSLFEINSFEAVASQLDKAWDLVNAMTTTEESVTILDDRFYSIPELRKALYRLAYLEKVAANNEYSDLKKCIVNILDRL